MKNVLPILFFFVLFTNVLSNKKTTKKIALAMKNIKERLEKQRKLQNQQETDLDSSDSEKGDDSKTASTSFPIEINGTEITTPKETDKIQSTIQIKKFHNFDRKPKQISFNVFFYFLNRIIVERIILRLKIIYQGKTRNLQENDISGESAASYCTIRDEFKDMVNTNGTGDNVDYNCSADTLSTKEITNVTIDTTYNMVVGDEEVGFEEINFDEEAAEESNNIVKIQSFDKSGVLEGSKIEFASNSFNITGKATPKNLLNGVDSIPIEFIDISRKEGKKNITCSVISVDASTSKYTLDCGSSIRTYISNITNAKSLDKDLYLKINMDQDETGEPVGTTGNNVYFNKKSSSGLSGGSIAAIVIACVIAILAVSIIAVMCRKSAPALDNTTVVDLKSVENV